MSRTNSMSVLRLYIAIWLLFMISGESQCCGPAEIGQQYTITSTEINVPPDAQIEWQLFLHIGVTLYDSSQSNPNVFPNAYTGTRTDLTIRNVTKNDGTNPFQHLVNEAVVYTCDLNVYKKASIPTCEPLTLTENQIRTKCTTTQVFPQAKCHFSLLNGDQDRRDVWDRMSYITYTHTEPKSGQNEYYSTSCTLEYPVNGLKPGNWTVQVNMYPDQTDVSTVQGTVGPVSNALQLSLPIVSINCPNGLAEEGDTNVKNGYIRQGESASCRCTRAHAGNPPGTIGWSSKQGDNFAIFSQSADEVTIVITPPEPQNPSDTFTCQSTSVLYGIHSMAYTPTYAYGPSYALLNIQPPGPIYLCPNQQRNVTIICQVPEDSFNPAPLFTIRDDVNTIFATKAAGDTAYKKSVSHNFTKSGEYNLTCRAENPIFSDILTDAPAKVLHVYEPPSDPPKISARSSQHGDVLMEGDDITVTCDVPGGYPSVISVTLYCGKDDVVRSYATSTKMTFNKIRQTCAVINCTCIAKHVTGCYDWTGVFPLSVISIDKTEAYDEDTLLITVGALAGIVVGVFVGTLLLVAVVMFFLYVMRKERHRPKVPNIGHIYDAENTQEETDYTDVQLDEFFWGISVL